MLKFVNFQLNTDPVINRDLHVELINEASGAKKTVRPYLDGSVRVNNLAPGAWRVLVKHPNLIHNVIDRRIKVLPDRPTFIPLKVPRDIFSDVPIRDTPEADLAPELNRLDEIVGSADDQAKKIAGQPIFAADWNAMAGTVGAVARTTRELAQKVSPMGHDHPELVEKLDELQININRFFDVFGQTVVQMQRQLQQLALRQQALEALDKISETKDVPPAKRKEVVDAIDRLGVVAEEPPDIYLREVKRVGEMVHAKILDAAAGDEVALSDKKVTEMISVVREMGRTPVVASYERELEAHKRIDLHKSTKNLSMLFK